MNYNLTNMKRIVLTLTLFLCFNVAKAQTCQELLEYVKSESYGTTYSSPLSTAISKVTFYDMFIDYQTHYFAVVCFKQQYSYGCSEYLYKVGSMTKTYYSMAYLESAGKAFWKYIQPYNENLECGPELE